MKVKVVGEVVVEVKVVRVEEVKVVGGVEEVKIVWVEDVGVMDNQLGMQPQGVEAYSV
jgi:hypothetical protein